MKTFTVRFTFGAAAHPIHYHDTDRTIFRTKYGDESVRLDDRRGWFSFGDQRIRVFRSQIDYTLWLDRREYLLEKLDLPTQAGIHCLGPTHWPCLDLIRSLGLQPQSPPRQVLVEFGNETTWTTTLRSGGKV